MSLYRAEPVVCRVAKTDNNVVGVVGALDCLELDFGILKRRVFRRTTKCA